MTSTGKALQVITAGSGFFIGYVWSVSRWADRLDPGSDFILRFALLPGAGLAAVYAVLLGTLFWKWIPTPRASGLQAVVSPVAFSVSLFVGALGIRSALWVLA